MSRPVAIACMLLVVAGAAHAVSNKWRLQVSGGAAKGVRITKNRE